MPRRIPHALAATAALTFLVAAPASAHVTIDPSTAAKGDGDIQMTFRVPNEEASANTVTLQVTFPTDHPIASVLVEPLPGWTVKVDDVTLPTPIKTDDGTITQAVQTVTWSGGQIAPGQYQAFPVMLGQLPSDTDKLVFKTLQTYSNGDIVRWIDVQQAGQPAPDHPAPVLELTAAEADGGASGGGAAPSSAPSVAVTSPASSTAPAAASKDSDSQGLAIAGLVVGALGLIAGGAAFARVARGSRTGGDQT
jgi:uncharacterized protein YcnI